MSKGIQIKKKLKIKIQNKNIISYDSIDNVFKNTFKCNMFDSDIKISIGKNFPESFKMELSCKINKHLSTDLLLNELTNHFPFYNIQKLANYDCCFFLDSMLFEKKGIGNVGYFFEPENDIKTSNDNNWVSIFIDDKEVEIGEIKCFVEHKYKEIINEITYIEIENFKTFTFGCGDFKKYVLDYQDFFI